MEMQLINRQHTHIPQLFKSFWIAGFESACQINSRGVRLDMLKMTQHDRFVVNDYKMLRAFGITTVRDGIRWPCIECEGKCDFSTFVPMLEAALNNGVQVIWNILHYGWPDDLDVFSPDFVSRFARFCQSVAKVIRQTTDEVPFYAPINEISFLAWAAGDVRYIYPHHTGRAKELKRQLIRAAIAGIQEIRAVDSRARFVYVEPIIHVVPPRDRPDLALAAAIQRASQFEAWDMLAGYVQPELGGDPSYLDILAVNYYHSNEWEYPENRLRWEDTPRDERWIPLHRLLAEVYDRYQLPMFIGETSHFGVGRGPWILEIASEVQEARRQGVPLEGVCLYPILDRPDWDDIDRWHNSGLWDLVPDERGTLRRVLNEDYAAALRRAQEIVTLPEPVGR
jgi:beta-glucosidase/6-phospho-beta-glucosidase/beta-galactosidase